MKKKSEIAGWARCLNIPQAVRDAIRGWPLVGFLLGERYLSAIEPPMKPEEGQHLVSGPCRCFGLPLMMPRREPWWSEIRLR
jgi:hypothetical protein